MTDLVVGTADDQPAIVAAERFNRHTFWCGQSGSGKTYALGVLLEQLLLKTSLPIVVFDPNADFVHLRSVRPGTDEADAAALASRDIRVLRAGAHGDDTLTARYVDLSLRSKAALLRLDPLIDLAEYNAMLHIEEAFRLADQGDLLDHLHATDEPANRVLAQRLENLGVLDWDVWSRGRVAATDVIDARPDATVLDLGGFPHPEEPLVIALAVLEHL